MSAGSPIRQNASDEDDSISADALSHAAYRGLRELLDIDQAQRGCER